MSKEDYLNQNIKLICNAIVVTQDVLWRAYIFPFAPSIQMKQVLKYIVITEQIHQMSGHVNVEM